MDPPETPNLTASKPEIISTTPNKTQVSSDKADEGISPKVVSHQKIDKEIFTAKSETTQPKAYQDKIPEETEDVAPILKTTTQEPIIAVSHKVDKDQQHAPNVVQGIPIAVEAARQVRADQLPQQPPDRITSKPNQINQVNQAEQTSDSQVIFQVEPPVVKVEVVNAKPEVIPESTLREEFVKPPEEEVGEIVAPVKKEDLRPVELSEKSAADISLQSSEKKDLDQGLGLIPSIDPKDIKVELARNTDSPILITVSREVSAGMEEDTETQIPQKENKATFGPLNYGDKLDDKKLPKVETSVRVTELDSITSIEQLITTLSNELSVNSPLLDSQGGENEGAEVVMHQREIKVSDEVMDLIESLILEVDLADDKQKNRVDYDYYENGMDVFVDRQPGVVEIKEGDKVTLGIQKDVFLDDDEEEQVDIAPVFNFVQLEQTFFHVDNLAVDKKQNIQKVEIVLSDQMMELVDNINKKIPIKSKLEEDDHEKRGLKTVIFSTQGRDKKQLSLSYEEFLRIRQYLLEYQLSSQKQMVMISSGDREIQIELVKLNHLLKLNRKKKRLHKSIYFKLNEQAPEEIVTNCKPVSSKTMLQLLALTDYKIYKSEHHFCYHPLIHCAFTLQKTFKKFR